VARPVLALDPILLDQTMEVGGAPTGQAVQVWNASVEPKVPMSYIVTKDVSWIQLGSLGGQSTGQQDRVGINFRDMTAFGEGTYTGRVTVVGIDAGGGYLPVGAVMVTNVVEVRVTVRTPAFPPPPPGGKLGGVVASDGLYEDRVEVGWTASAGAVGYEVWRGATFDYGYASKLAEVGATNWTDTLATPGVVYYYWVRPVNPYGGAGLLSSNDSGYRALSPPGGVFATDGTYTNKVRVMRDVGRGDDVCVARHGRAGSRQYQSAVGGRRRTSDV
jgi:hypothetical protein